MFHGHKFILHGFRLIFGFHQRRVYRLGNVDLVHFPAVAGNPGNPVDFGGDGGGELLFVHAHFVHQLADHAALLTYQGQQQMLLINLRIAIADHQLLGLADGLHGFLRIFFSVH